MRYRRKAGHESSGLGERDVEGFDPAEFLARVIMHVPEPRRYLVRYYFWYSNVSRGRRRKNEPEHEGAVDVGGGIESRARAEGWEA